MRRFGAAVAVVAAVTILVPGCGEEASEGAGNERGHSPSSSVPSRDELDDAERICAAYQPPNDPDAELVAFSLSTVREIRDGLEAFDLPPLDPDVFHNEEAVVARCSYLASSTTTAPTTICPDGSTVSLAAPLQFLVSVDGVAAEDPGANFSASLPC